jgi:hypothetical protein
MDPGDPVFGRIEAFEEGIATAPPTPARAARPERIEKPVVVRIGKEVKGTLDIANPRDAVWLDIMRSLHAAGRPVYVEIDRTGRITQFLQPLEQPVGEIREIENGDVQVELMLSHAVHVLRPSHPQFKQLLERLRDAQRDGKLVWVIETPDSHEILDVR